ncbi:MAG: phosphoenolpyruvate--protein phosphotransferase [bacterium]
MSSDEHKTASGAQPGVWRGVGAAPGVAFGPALVVRGSVDEIPAALVAAENIAAEIERLEQAVTATRDQLAALREAVRARVSGDEADIFDSHLMVLGDPQFLARIIKIIRAQRCNAESAVRIVADKLGGKLAGLKDEYLRERAADVQDVARRLIRNLLGIPDGVPRELDRPCVIVADALTPSETVLLPRERVLGFVTDRGSATSHAALLARALEIPAVVGLHNFSSEVRSGDEVLLDGARGIVVLRPSRQDLEAFHKIAMVRRRVETDLLQLLDLPAVTPDGHTIRLHANIENNAECASAMEHGAEGIGLYRTEYLWLTRGRPATEAEQIEVYSAAARAMAPRPVIIRVLDLGGDKFMGGTGDPREDNPFLGIRSIRYLLRHPEVFRAQLRAILHASACGDVQVMYPMISDVSEIKQANELLRACQRELAAEGAPCNPHIRVGAMIEIPSAALTADVLAEHVDFFCIGTNDLIQYTLAVDRVNDNVIHLYQPTHPAVLRLIQMTIDAGHRHDIWVGVCGEMTADPMLAMLLLGMGVDELSMAPTSIPAVKDVIRKTALSEARQLAEAARHARTASEVLRLCREFMRHHAPELLELV